ncbi:Myb family DNA-binding domain containing protein [Entamoeba marina]
MSNPTGNTNFATLREILQQRNNPPSATTEPPKAQVYANESEMQCHRFVLESICEYLIDHKIESDLYTKCITERCSVSEEVSVSLRRKKNLEAALSVCEHLTPQKTEVELLEKALTYVVELYKEDSKNETLRSLPSLIGLTGMISLFYQFVEKVVPIQTLWDWLDLLLPAASVLPYVKTSRSCSEEAIVALSQANLPEEIVDPTDVLMSIQQIQQILSRYPIEATLDHIKVQLEKYRENLPPSQIEASLYPLVSETYKPYYIEHKADDDKTQKTKKRTEKQMINKPVKAPVDENGQVVKKKKRRFTEEETQNLIEGVNRFGVGHWKTILNNFQFDGRSCVDLKDKWRNLEFSRMRTSNRMKANPTHASPPPLADKTVLPSVSAENKMFIQQGHDYIPQMDEQQYRTDVPQQQ